MSALYDAGQLTEPQRAFVVKTMRDEYCVDFELDPDWLTGSAEADGWEPGPAMTSIARPYTWDDMQAAMTVWQALASRAGEAEPLRVRHWVYAATHAVVRRTDPGSAQRLAAGVVAFAASAVGGDAAAFAACVNAARAASTEMEIPSPTEMALEWLFESLAEKVGPGPAATALAQLGAELDGEDREALRRVILDAG